MMKECSIVQSSDLVFIDLDYDEINIFNPSALYIGDCFYMLTRSETNVDDFSLTISSYNLVKMDRNFLVLSTKRMKFKIGAHSFYELPRQSVSNNIFAMNDIRMIDNLVTLEKGDLITYGTSAAIPTPHYDTETHLNLVVKQCVSRINLSGNTIEFVNFIVTPNCRQREKNFTILNTDNIKYLIYQAFPFITYQINNLKDVCNRRVYRYGLDRSYYDETNFYSDLVFSNSTAPIIFDDDSYLMLVHTKDIRRRFVHYALLINKEKAIPIKITKHPVIKGGVDNLPDIIYVSSICIVEGALYIFMGYDDRKCVVCCIDLEYLNNSFASISG